MTDKIKKIQKLKRRQAMKLSTDEPTPEAKKEHQRPMARARVLTGVAVRSDLWKRLRALAITEGRLTGDLLDEAIGNYLKFAENK